MKKQGTYSIYCGLDIGDDENGKDINLVGFVADIGLFGDKLLHPVYLFNGILCVGALVRFPLADVLKEVGEIYHAFGYNTLKAIEYIKEIASYGYVNKDDFWKKEYAFLNKETKDDSEIIYADEVKVVKEDGLVITDTDYIAAIRLSDKKIIVGHEEFLERVILDEEKNEGARYRLLAILYTTFHKYRKRNALINELFANGDDSLMDELAGIKKESDYVVYALDLLEKIKNDEKNIELKRV